MTRKSGALAGLVALAVLALWGVALGLSGDDVPLVPPSVELGGPSVTIAPAVTAGGETPGADQPAVRSDDDGEGTPATRPAPERRDGAPVGGEERPADHLQAAGTPDDDGTAMVVAALPVRVGGDEATPIAEFPSTAPTTPPAGTPSTGGGTAERPSTTTVPAPTAAPVTDEVAAPGSDAPPRRPSEGSRDPEPAPLHVDDGSCAAPGSHGLARAAARTEGTPASPPPRGHGPGCTPGTQERPAAPQPARQGDGPDDGQGRGELQAVRERDDEAHDRGRARGGAGGGRRAGGR